MTIKRAKETLSPDLNEELIRSFQAIVPREIAAKMLVAHDDLIGGLIDKGDLEELTFRKAPWVVLWGVMRLQKAWGVTP